MINGVSEPCSRLKKKFLEANCTFVFVCMPHRVNNNYTSVLLQLFSTLLLLDNFWKPFWRKENPSEFVLKAFAEVFHDYRYRSKF